MNLNVKLQGIKYNFKKVRGLNIKYHELEIF
jgi:hypothetical protein